MKSGKNSARDRLHLVRMTALLIWFVPFFVPRMLAQNAREQPARPKRVLALYWYNKDYPGNIRFDQSFQKTFQSAPAGSVEYYAEYMESNRFPAETHSLALRDYLRQKYAARPIDVIVTVADAPLNFLLKYRDIFPNTPIVFLALNRPSSNDLVDGPGLTGLLVPNSHRQTLDLALSLHPDTREVFVVSGTPQHDKRFEITAREQLEGYKDNLTVTYLTDLRLSELIAKIKTLPERSIVLYVWQQVENEQGVVLETAEFLSIIAQSTHVPIYGMSARYVGSGLVGGYVITAETNATRMAEIALEIVRGARAQDMPVQDAPVVIMFDWRQLQRLGISEDRLPPGSIIRFREPSFWDLYKWRIIGVVSLCLVETFLILVLLAQRSRRGRAEAALRESEEALRESHRHIEELAGRLITAQEEERKYIARELHDDLNQRVATLAIGLVTLKRQLHDLDGPGRNQLTKLEDRTRALSEQIRRLSHELHSSTLEHVGLMEALKLQCSESLEQQGLEVSFDMNGGVQELDSDVALCLYRVAQESLRNVAKHSGAKRAELSLVMNDGSVEMRIADRGIGFDLEKLRGRGGIGLTSIQERVRLLGGHLEVKSQPGAGTELKVCVPVRSRPEQPESAVG